MQLLKKYILVILFITSLSGFVRPTECYAFPPKIKALMIVAGYGAGGGALLGVASMAFGAPPITIAQGASLGLYAGLLFGSYIVFTHKSQSYQNQNDNAPYPKGVGPYQEGGEGQDTEGDPNSEEVPSTQNNIYKFSNPHDDQWRVEVAQLSSNLKEIASKNNTKDRLINLNFFYYEF